VVHRLIQTLSSKVAGLEIVLASMKQRAAADRHALDVLRREHADLHVRHPNATTNRNLSHLLPSIVLFFNSPGVYKQRTGHKERNESAGIGARSRAPKSFVLLYGLASIVHLLDCWWHLPCDLVHVENSCCCSDLAKTYRMTCRSSL
jgi:hypothetical protein